MIMMMCVAHYNLIQSNMQKLDTHVVAFKIFYFVKFNDKNYKIMLTLSQ